MRFSLLLRIAFVALLWSAAGNAELYAAYCEDCGRDYDTCTTNAYNAQAGCQYGCGQSYPGGGTPYDNCVGECNSTAASALDACYSDLISCGSTCESGSCSAATCNHSSDCSGTCGFLGAEICSSFHRCCCGVQ